MTITDRQIVSIHQHKDWSAGRKWVCRCNLCEEERKHQREQDKLLVRGVDYNDLQLKINPVSWQVFGNVLSARGEQ